MKHETLELTRNNVTPAQFCAYVRRQIKNHNFEGISPHDIDLEYWKRGDDMNFYIKGDGDRATEKSISKPYEMQTYIAWGGDVYNLIMEFDFWDDKTGVGYFYYLNKYND